MPWKCEPGRTLFLPSGDHDHLFVVLDGPTDYVGCPPQHCITVNFSTIENAPYDDTVVADVGDHPFLKHPSYVNYRGLQFRDASQLEKLVQQGLFTPREPVSPQLLARLVHGLGASTKTPRYIKELKKKT